MLIPTAEPTMINPIVETYSQLAEKYDDDLNQNSCWGRASQKILGSLVIEHEDHVVLDMGCGTGRALLQLAGDRRPDVQFIGIDPAANMCKCAARSVQHCGNARILEGCFEQIPVASASIDYLYSIFAFHWVTDLDAAVKEIRRVLKPNGRMDLFFIGRNNGNEFIRKTTPIFLKHMGPALLADSVRMRKQLTREEAQLLFAKTFDRQYLTTEESYETYYDSLEGHWGWWVRIEGQLVSIPPNKRAACDREVQRALAGLVEEKGIPYTIHCLHVKLRS
jgi:ubiquinone/menaquinone biosynthesis C-methylase UbiE